MKKHMTQKKEKQNKQENTLLKETLTSILRQAHDTVLKKSAENVLRTVIHFFP